MATSGTGDANTSFSRNARNKSITKKGGTRCSNGVNVPDLKHTTKLAAKQGNQNFR